jgi:hypothetical protein
MFRLLKGHHQAKILVIKSKIHTHRFAKKLKSQFYSIRFVTLKFESYGKEIASDFMFYNQYFT